MRVWIEKMGKVFWLRVVEYLLPSISNTHTTPAAEDNPCRIWTHKNAARPQPADSVLALPKSAYGSTYRPIS